MIATQLTPSLTYHGEGAIWHGPWGGLRFVDMLAGDILLLDDATGAVTRTPVGSEVAAMVRPRVGGGVVVATRSTFRFFDADGALERESTPIVAAGARFNEGAVDPLGRILCGTIGDEAEPGRGDLWRLESDGTPTRVLEGGTVSNGLAFSADGALAYYVDTPTRRVDVFDVDASGELSGRRLLVDVSDLDGYPDGMCLDAEGGLWVAFYDGSAVHRFDPSGSLTATVEVPGATRTTSCTIGGPSGTQLFITTSREGLAADEQPAAGALFTAEAGVRGATVREVAA